MGLKERILDEMVVDEEILSTTKEIFDKLPGELQTPSTFLEIEKKIKESTKLISPLRRPIENETI